MIVDAMVLVSVSHMPARGERRGVSVLVALKFDCRD